MGWKIPTQRILSDRHPNIDSFLNVGKMAKGGCVATPQVPFTQLKESGDLLGYRGSERTFFRPLFAWRKGGRNEISFKNSF
jgi:hypothetical protein